MHNLKRNTLITVLLFLALPILADDTGPNLISNPGFEPGAKGWQGLGATQGGEVVTDPARAHSGKRFVILTAEDANVGIDSDPIYAGSDFSVKEQQVVSAVVSNLGIERGSFGLRFYCYDAKGKYVAMKSVGDMGPESPRAGWQRIEMKVGPGTEFDFPKETDHMVVRFSFYAKENNCKGKAMIDDVFFGPPAEKAPITKRKLRRTEKGAVAVWRDQVPVVGAASDPDYIASLLEAGGFGVSFVTTSDLIDPAILNRDNCDLLILPYGECYPAKGANALRRYLRGGGSFISLGGPCFRELLYPSRDGWIHTGEAKSNGKSLRKMARVTNELVASLNKELDQGDEPAKVSLAQDPDGNPALCVAAPDLKTFKYIAFDIDGSADQTIVHFRARGDEETKHLCIELNEDDKSRWKAIVDLTPGWKTCEISAGEFISYATETRGGKDDYCHAERAKKISFGFPKSLVGGGKRSFEISEIEWRSSDVPPQDMVGGSVLLAPASPLFRAFGEALRPVGGAGDITAFFGSESFHDVGSLRAAPNQIIFPKDANITGHLSGLTTTILDDNLHVLQQRKVAGRPFLPTEKLVRAVPLLLTPSGRPAASLFVNIAGRYADSVWACFGVTGLDLFSKGDREMGRAFVRLADRMLGGAFFARIEPRFTVRGGQACMEVVVEATNRGPVDRMFELRSRLVPIKGERSLTDSTMAVSLAPGETEEIVALTVEAEGFDWKAFRVECRLVSDGEVIDLIQTSVDVRETLLAICDRFVERQKERGDGKFHGYAFVDNRGTRGLLAAYDLTKKKEYLDAAIAWGDAIIREQREDGGYLMGYGYYPEGNECFVADGGETACGIANLIEYVPKEEKKRFMDSLRTYMRYRDLFRCEGGGIGVGWCKHDYGARPITKLDKITKIFSPENNIYTIGCTLTAATMYARLTKDPKDNEAAVRDAYWWMERCKSTTGGAFCESAIWANKFLKGETIRKGTEEFLRQKFIPYVVKPDSEWWTTGEGRTVQGIDGLCYYYDCIEKDPDVLAALMRATYHVCSPEALSGIPRILPKKELSWGEWCYLNFASVSLPDLVQSEIIRKGF